MEHLQVPEAIFNEEFDNKVILRITTFGFCKT
jgi:hypothetical protein